jgi:hypothetical protein
MYKIQYMVSSFAFVVIKGPSLIKIISARNQDIIMVYEALIKVDIYGVGLANTRAQHMIIIILRVSFCSDIWYCNILAYYLDN